MYAGYQEPSAPCFLDRQFLLGLSGGSLLFRGLANPARFLTAPGLEGGSWVPGGHWSCLLVQCEENGMVVTYAAACVELDTLSSLSPQSWGELGQHRPLNGLWTFGLGGSL